MFGLNPPELGLTSIRTTGICPLLVTEIVRAPDPAMPVTDNPPAMLRTDACVEVVDFKLKLVDVLEEVCDVDEVDDVVVLEDEVSIGLV